MPLGIQLLAGLLGSSHAALSLQNLLDRYTIEEVRLFCEVRDEMVFVIEPLGGKGISGKKGTDAAFLNDQKITHSVLGGIFHDGFSYCRPVFRVVQIQAES